MGIIKLENLEYTINEGEKTLQILKDVNLEVNKGEFHLITGPSGSGKTTLLQIIATFLNHTNGTRELFDTNIPPSATENDLYAFRKNIGYLFQTPYIPSHINVFEYIVLQATISGSRLSTAEEKASELLEEFGVNQFKKVHSSKLSGGEKQRIALAGLIIKDIKLLLLDEPTGSLDYENSILLWEKVHQLKQDDITIIAVTHDDSVKDIADKIHRLDYGIIT